MAAAGRRAGALAALGALPGTDAVAVGPGHRTELEFGVEASLAGPGHQREQLSADVADGLAPGRSVSLAGGCSPGRSVIPGGPPARDDGSRPAGAWPAVLARPAEAGSPGGGSASSAGTPARSARRWSWAASDRAGWPNGTVSSTETGAPAASARSAALIASQFRLTSSGPETLTSANTWGWRRISLATMPSATSSMV